VRLGAIEAGAQMSGKVVVIEQELLKSEVFRSSSGTGKTVYFDFRMKCRVKSVKKYMRSRKERVILNNGKLEYCYSEAEKRGIPRTTFMRALNELIAKGLIDIEHSGSGGVKGDKSLYAISERWRAYGAERFIEAARPKDTRGGRGFKPGNREWMKTRRLKSLNIGAKNGNRKIRGKRPRALPALVGAPFSPFECLECQKWQYSIDYHG
jgi:DNA-binding PadR family transcriptional regulator